MGEIRAPPRRHGASPMMGRRMLAGALFLIPAFGAVFGSRPIKFSSTFGNLL